MKGWNYDRNSVNFNLRSQCVLDNDFDILGIAESHLLNDDILQLDGYTWFGFNRNNIHIRAKSGSGGIGFFIRNSVLNMFDISIEDNTVEGIFWLRMCNKQHKSLIFPCVCYLLRKIRPDIMMLTIFMIHYCLMCIYYNQLEKFSYAETLIVE